MQPKSIASYTPWASDGASPPGSPFREPDGRLLKPSRSQQLLFQANQDFVAAKWAWSEGWIVAGRFNAA
jgi:hypothetical protein